MGMGESKPEDDDPYSMLLRVCLKDAPPAAVLNFQLTFEEFDFLILKVASDQSTMARKRLIGCTINPATDHIHMDLAASLVSRYPELNETRRICVPSKMSEAHFWSNFFDGLTVEVLRVVLKQPQSAAYTHGILAALSNVSWDPRQLQP
mmetsp:Transcript_1139/g.2355  ORF Transcript_1139/g.2355 Transcript_1139/m.2355 type:complete len:149 (+) Transcript_1139:137-583(+)|eukprot:CAMPEP_0114252558 /NCGR_PEP_ID=MMETSP0058-20121206/15902_1 /TAXON_ID=36894 /ORGANISM="Pyramimonas parkeae, CCMP726" /LENGTH=148 /DNA_ID=CAMNT_0001366503 /DNA_START=197 /DNA_END=643 /DNA_ORIENTATION=+